jgi:hypothetical protein
MTSNIEILSYPKAVSMTDEWFQFATADTDHAELLAKVVVTRALQ